MTVKVDIRKASRSIAIAIELWAVTLADSFEEEKNVMLE